MTKHNKKLQTLALISTLLAIAVHIYLSKHFYGLKFGALTDNSFCNVNELFNCDTASASKYSSLFNIPIALWGAVTNFTLLILILVNRLGFNDDSEKSQRYPLYLSFIIFLTSIVMGIISVTTLKTYCLFCMLNYLLSFVCFISLWITSPKKVLTHTLKDIKDLLGTNRGTFGILASTPVIVFIAHSMALQSYGMSDIANIAKEKIAYWNASPAQKFDELTGLVFYKGGDTPPVMTIIEFADFKCSHCKHAYPSLHSFAKSHPDVKLIYKPFALDGLCNSAITGGDGSRCRMVYATFCAEKLGQKGWELHNHIFDNQEAYFNDTSADDKIQKYAENLGINAEEFKTCISSSEIQKMAQAIAEEGVTAKIQGTPTVFVNSKLLSGGQLLPILDAAYQDIKKK